MAHTPVVERHVIHEHDSDDSSTLSIFLLLIVVIAAGFFLYMMGALSFLNEADTDTTRIEIEGNLPPVNPPTDQGSTAY